MTLLVCGSRSWTDKATIQREIEAYKPALVIHGGARGADHLAGLVCADLHITCNVFVAHWKKGISAGYVRNYAMLKEGKPDEVLAFWDGRSRGTAHMISLAKKAGLPVRVVEQKGELNTDAM